MRHLFRDMATCPICSATSQSTVYPSTIDFDKVTSGQIKAYEAHYSINRCDQCGLVLSNPVFAEDQVRRLYEHAEATNVAEREDQNVRWTMQYYYRLVQPYLCGRQKMLDVGCDVGYLLQAAAEDGFAELHGIEPNRLARVRAQTIPRAVIFDTFYEDATYPESSFDLVSLVHVLDHVYDPRAVLERAYRQLKPGGVLIAVVHNVNCLLRRVLGERFPVFNLYHHYFFSKQTLGALGSTAGFDVKNVVSTKNCYSLNFFLKKMPLLPAFIKRPLAWLLSLVGIGSLPITIPVGNIALIAQRRA